MDLPDEVWSIICDSIVNDIGIWSLLLVSKRLNRLITKKWSEEMWESRYVYAIGGAPSVAGKDTNKMQRYDTLKNKWEFTKQTLPTTLRCVFFPRNLIFRSVHVLLLNTAERFIFLEEMSATALPLQIVIDTMADQIHSLKLLPFNMHGVMCTLFASDHIFM